MLLPWIPWAAFLLLLKCSKSVPLSLPVGPETLVWMGFVAVRAGGKHQTTMMG